MKNRLGYGTIILSIRLKIILINYKTALRLLNFEPNYIGRLLFSFVVVEDDPYLKIHNSTEFYFP